MRSFHPLYIPEVFFRLVPFLWVTVAMVIGTVFFGGAAGILLAAAQVRKGRLSKLLANIYIYTTRCIPSIVMLFVVYYGLPELLLTVGIDINRVGKGFFVITTFSVLFAASIAEVFRSAYQTVDKGQREAAVTIGLTPWQAFYRIVLPQCTVIALPNFANALVNLMKEGSLAYTIGLIDIMGKGQLIIGQNQGSYVLETYLALTVLYFLLTFAVEKSFGYLEKRLLKGKKMLSYT